MRIHVFTIIILLIGNQLMAQQKTVGVQYVMPAAEQEFNIEMVYNKLTGEKVSQETFNRLVEKNPKLYLERVYDKKGRVIRYYYDPNNQDNIVFRDPESVASSGAGFPPFVLKTIEGNTLELENLKGKLVLLRFELYCTDFRFKKHEIEDLDNKINQLENKEDVEAIIIFRDKKAVVEKSFPFSDSNFQLVADGMRFFDKYQIKRFPMTALIDREGNLIKYFNYSEDIILEDYISN